MELKQTGGFQWMDHRHSGFTVPMIDGWGTEVKLKVHNSLCRNQTVPQEEKEVNESSEFSDHHQWLDIYWNA